MERPKVYQYLICPFCNRVKSYMDFVGIEYDTIEVNPLTKSEINFPVTTKKVPIVILDGKTFEDSSVIIEAITKYSEAKQLKSFPGKSFFPADTEKWNEWSEKRLAVMLYPNITRSFEESWECFAYSANVGTWSALQRVIVRTIGPAAMSLANGRIKKKYGIVDERKELKAVLAEWCDALKGQKFLHGDKPTMPDVLVFGVLKSIQGLRTFEEIMQETPVLKIWYDNVDSCAPSRVVRKM
ncbi:glutathione S-transferase [Ochromonadaceae sp. CCMP2298]|nr:glutathione S-transferase [Ochromonadaceae sp. CCMP2298]